ncbi:acyltransferase [Bdellovibrio sp. HCB-110]|uniref:acyltransferase n=1 Tax=Bdellovibrio sp. HCB-110 TaxID=3391182 RepID=UPI0039B5CC48
MNPFIHETAIIEDGVLIGENTKIWHFSHVRRGARISEDCSVGRDCYVDSKVIIGKGSRVQNGVSIYNGVSLAESTFVGPHVVFTNDMFPRAGSKKWDVSETYLETGCSLGAGAIIRCGIRIGSFSMVGAGALVTKSIPPFTLATGFPAKPIRRICACGRTQSDLLDRKWIPVNNCCHEYLTDHVLELAKAAGERLIS